MVYKVKFLEDAREDLWQCTDYLLHEVGGIGSDQAARGFYKEIERAIKRLTLFPKSFALYDDAELSALGLHKMHLRHYKYKILFHIIDDTVIIDLICHDLRDYETLIKTRLQK